MNLKLVTLVAVLAILSSAGTFLALANLPSTSGEGIVCPKDGSTYVWTPIGTFGENFNWVCLKCGDQWTKSYPDDFYQSWRKVPLEPSYIRDYALLYLQTILRLDVPDPLTLYWVGERETPTGILGHECYTYRAEDITVTVSYPVVHPDLTTYQIEVKAKGATLWTGTLHHREFSSPRPQSDDINTAKADGQTEQDPVERAKRIARSFIMGAPTFNFDGIQETLSVESVDILESLPVQYKVTITFESRQAGYGDRTGQASAQVITPHTASVTVVQDKVASAILDGIWDELKQQPVT